MREIRRRELIDSIEYSASVISAEKGSETVRNILKMYGSEDIDNLSTAELEDVFGELFQREADSKD